MLCEYVAWIYYLLPDDLILFILFFLYMNFIHEHIDCISAQTTRWHNKFNHVSMWYHFSRPSSSNQSIGIYFDRLRSIDAHAIAHHSFQFATIRIHWVGSGGGTLWFGLSQLPQLNSEYCAIKRATAQNACMHKMCRKWICATAFVHSNVNELYRFSEPIRISFRFLSLSLSLFIFNFQFE